MADAAIHGHEHEDQRGFFTRWFMSTNHKDIGILYLVVSALVGFIAVAFTVYMRLELMNQAFNTCVWRECASQPQVLVNVHQTAISGMFSLRAMVS